MRGTAPVSYTDAGAGAANTTADHAETLRYVSGLGSAVLAVATVAFAAVLLHPPLIGWFWS